MTNLIYKLYIVGTFLAFTSVTEAKVDETWGSGGSYLKTSYNSAAELKKTKKLGLGVSAAGAAGLLGTNLAINFTESFTFIAGVGVSRGFNSVNIQFKHSFGGNQLLPYFVAGYSNWYSKDKGSALEKTSPDFFQKKFLSGREKKTGDFAENIIYPGVGVEFINSRGDWSGLGFFAEILYMLDIDDLVAAPTAGVGTIYYF